MNDSLNHEQEQCLLHLARKAMSQHLETGKKLEVKVKDKTLRQKKGAFVTIKKKEALRGCIGYPYPDEPLYAAIIDAAISAAFKDYRFSPLNKDELAEVKIEISVLDLPQPVKDVSKIKLGQHGIIVSKEGKKGLLLPQVPIEWGWDLETFLGYGCLKAGLDEEAWKHGAEIQIFTAQVFSE